MMDSARFVSALKSDGKLIRVRLSLSTLRVDDKVRFIGILRPAPSPVIKIETTKSGVITSVSKNITKFLGYVPRNIVGENVSLLCPEPIRSFHDRYMSNYLKTGVSKLLGRARNMTTVCRDGTQKPVSIWVSPTRHGFKGKLVVIDSDIEVMMSVDRESLKVTSCTEHAKHIFGKLPEQMVGSSLTCLFSSAFSPSLDGSTLSVIAQCHDGSTLPVSVECNAISDDPTKFRVRVVSRETSQQQRQALDSDSDEFPSTDESSETSESSTTNIVEQGPAVLGHYEMCGVLGTGYFGSVRKALHLVTGQYVAIKTLRKEQFEEIGMKYPPREVSLLRNVPPHPHLVQLYDIIETNSRIYLVQEFVSGGDFFDYCASRGPLNAVECQFFFRQLVRGVSWLHQHNIVHRDLKIENCILDEDKQLKIIDLGLGTIYDGNIVLSTFCGSPDYAAPELFMRKKYQGPPVDIWALGVMLYVMATGFVPFDTPQSVVDVKFVFPKSMVFDADIVRLIYSIFVFNPSDRPSIQKLRVDPWLKLPESEQVVQPGINADIVADVVKKMGCTEDLVRDALGDNTRVSTIKTCYHLLMRKKE